MIRWLRYRSILVVRQYSKQPNSWGTKLLGSNMILWNQDSVSKGVAIGMFWAFAPMPFQMIPATLFCILLRANLPIAILCVWITNPITLPPVIYIEYRIGEAILGALANISTEIPDSTISLYKAFTGGLRFVLTGSLVLSSSAMILGYVFMLLLFKYSQQKRKTIAIKNK